MRSLWLAEWCAATSYPALGYPARWVSLLTGHDPQPRISIFVRGSLPCGVCCHRGKFHRGDLVWGGVRTQENEKANLTSNPLYHTPPPIIPTLHCGIFYLVHNFAIVALALSPLSSWHCLPHYHYFGIVSLCALAFLFLSCWHFWCPQHYIPCRGIVNFWHHLPHCTVS